MSIMQFASATGVGGSLVPLSNLTITDTRTSTANADARIEFRNDGTIFQFRSQFGFSQRNIGEWFYPQPWANIGDLYEVRSLTETSGIWQVEAAASNVWIAITATRQWQVINTQDSGSTVEVIATMEVRRISDTSDVESLVATVRAVVVE